MKRENFLSAMIPLLIMTISLGAQETSGDFQSDDALFGDGDALVTETSGSEENAAASLLVSESVKIGGAFTFSMESESEIDEWGNDPVHSFVPSTDLGVDVFIDARPKEDFRVFAKGSLTYPFQGEGDAEIKEVFADLVPLEGVYVRAGKQTANWGVGYFFSPANLLSLERIDPEDPEAELTGPLAIKAQIPVGTTNYYGYLIMDETDGGETITIAPKLEAVFGSTELSVGGLYRQDAPWAVMATATGKIKDVDVFAEGVIRGDEDKIYVVEDAASPTAISTETRDGDLFVQATIGFSWSRESDSNFVDLVLRGQYYYNGMGYSDPSMLRDQSDLIGILVASGTLNAGDLAERGRHYAAASLAFLDILDSDTGVTIFWLGNLADESGRTSATLSWERLDHLKLSATYACSYGAEGSEYAPNGLTPSVTLKLTVTETTF